MVYIDCIYMRNGLVIMKIQSRQQAQRNVALHVLRFVRHSTFNNSNDYYFFFEKNI